MTQLNTCEFTAQGHPDKIADQISDAIVDACLIQDPNSRVACEVLVSRQLIAIAGEITTSAKVNYEAIAHKVIGDIGYQNPALGFSSNECRFIQAIQHQSPDIALGLSSSEDLPGQMGAADQGIMIGFACDETPQAMPLAYELSRKLMQSLRRARSQGQFPYLRPDGKSQVTVQSGDGRSQARIHTIVLSCQHDESVSIEQLRHDIYQWLLCEIQPELLDRHTCFHVNPTGRFVIGGPAADTGLTGRKIIADTYGPFVPHGGGAFSGKDPSKVDRSAAYACRYLAKNIVKAGLARQAQVQVAYTIGRAEPTAFRIDTVGYPGRVRIDKRKLELVCLSLFDMKPASIIHYFNLLRPIYQSVSYGGHFGREDLDLPWERLDLVEPLQEAFSSYLHATHHL